MNLGLGPSSKASTPDAYPVVPEETVFLLDLLRRFLCSWALSRPSFMSTNGNTFIVLAFSAESEDDLRGLFSTVAPGPHTVRAEAAC